MDYISTMVVDSRFQKPGTVTLVKTAALQRIASAPVGGRQ
jgi:hypothetical protein